MGWRLKNVQILVDDLGTMPIPTEAECPPAVATDATAIAVRVRHAVDFYLTHGVLSDLQRQELSHCRDELQRLNPQMHGRAQVYFGKLYRLCDVVASKS